MRPSGRVTGFTAPHQLIRTPARAPISVPPACHIRRAKLGFQQTCRNSLHKPMPAFQINQSVKAVRNYSTVDSCYMPHFEIEGQAHPEIGRIPLLPDNHSNEGAKAARQEAMMETVVRPEISTVSADGTHIDCPSAMSEVTDNHAIELDPYDLTNKVKAAASTKASIQVEKVKEQGLLAEIWNSLLDDLVGSKKLAKG